MPYPTRPRMPQARLHFVEIPCPTGYGISTAITIGHLVTIFVPEP